ncbi:sugar ABC transporter permease [Dactylosporangium maewongense]|uniref:Sugar ABC transporter permease n=1 Tax=Dactylosporangium maewongense TaxID=634393 RepID=A0ABN2DIH6_9ACTN
MVLPCLALLAVFHYWPLLRGALFSVYASDLLGNPTRFVGAQHYVELATDPGLRQVLVTTAAVAALSVVLAVGGALLAALPLRRAARRPRAVASLVLSLPFAYSAGAASAVFAGLFAPAVGTVNAVLAGVGVAGPDWLQSRGWAIVSVSVATAWYEFGFAFLVLLAALTRVDPGIIEAAALDGAGEWRTNWSVVVPAVRPSLLFLVVTQTVSGLQIFTQVHVLTKGGPGGGTSTLVYELYLRAFGSGLPDSGLASTLALLLVVLVLAVIGLQFVASRRWT